MNKETILANRSNRKKISRQNKKTYSTLSDSAIEAITIKFKIAQLKLLGIAFTTMINILGCLYFIYLGKNIIYNVIAVSLLSALTFYIIRKNLKDII